jgi:hypothetical protein
MILNLATLVRAKSAEYLNSARNGLTGCRPVKARSIRLPDEVWTEVQDAATALRIFFPDRYVTVNSTVQFLISEGLRSLYETND